MSAEKGVTDELSRISRILVGIDTRLQALEVTYAGINTACDTQNQALQLVIQTQETIDNRLQIIEKACTAEHGPSPLLEPIQQLAAEAAKTNEKLDGLDSSIHENTEKLDEVKTAIQSMRGP
jgi:chromosome segregation ATPase